MKIDGLGDERRIAINQIRTFVEDVNEFTDEQFNKVVEQFKKEDAILHRILDESKQIATANYTRYLNGILVGGKMGFGLASFGDLPEEGTILGKALGEMRERISKGSDYRKQFLGPQIGKQAQVYDIQMRRAQKEEVKLQKQEQKVLAKGQRKGLGYFGFGL